MRLQRLVYVELILVQLLSMATGQAVFAIQRKGKPYQLCSSKCYIGQLESDIPGKGFHAVIAEPAVLAGASSCEDVLLWRLHHRTVGL